MPRAGAASAFLAAQPQVWTRGPLGACRGAGGAGVRGGGGGGGGGAAGDRPGEGSGYELLWVRIKAAGLGCAACLYDSSPHGVRGQGRLAW